MEIEFTNEEFCLMEEWVYMEKYLLRQIKDI